MKLTKLNVETLNLISNRLEPYINYDFGNQFANKSDIKSQIHGIFCNKHAAVVICKQVDTFPTFKQVGSEHFMEQCSVSKVQVFFALNVTHDYSLSESLVDGLLTKIKYQDNKPIYTEINPSSSWSARIILHNTSIFLIYSRKIVRISLHNEKLSYFKLNEKISTLIFSKDTDLFWICSSSRVSSEFTEMKFFQWNASSSLKNPQAENIIRVKNSQFDFIAKNTLTSDSILFFIEGDGGKFMIVSSTTILLFEKTNGVLLQVIRLINARLNTFEKISLEILQLDNCLFFRDGSNYWIFEEDIENSKLATVFSSCDTKKNINQIKGILTMFKGQEWYSTERAKFVKNWSIDLYNPILSRFNELLRPSRDVLLYIVAKRLMQDVQPGYFNFVYHSLQKYETSLLPALEQIKLWLIEHYNIEL